MNLARATAKLFAARIGTSVLQFLGIAYFAWELGAAPLGVFFLFQAVVASLGIPADFGLAGAVEKRISEGERQGAFLASGIALKLVPVAIIVAAVLAFAGRIDAYVGAQVAALLAVCVVLEEASRLALAALKGELRVGETATIEVAATVTWLVVGVLLVQRGHGALALVYGRIAGSVVKTTLSWSRCSVRPGAPSAADARSLLDYGKFDVVSSLGAHVFNWMDVLVVGYFLTEAHVGAYEIAWRVTAVVLLLSQSIGAVLFPQISSWDAADASDRIAESVRDSITPSLVFVLPAFVGTALLSREILGVVFGPEFTVAWLALVVLMADKLTGAVNIVFDNALRGIDRPDLVAYTTVSAIALNLVLNVGLVPTVGLEGAAVATAVSALVMVSLNAYFLSRFVPLDLPAAEVGWCTGSALLMGAVTYGFRTVVGVDGPVTLVVVVGLGAATYGLAVLSFRPLRSKVRLQLRSLRSDEVDASESAG